MAFLLKYKHIEVYVGENTDEIARLASESRALLIQTLLQVGFVADTQFLNSADFGARTARGRAWIIALRYASLGISIAEATACIADMWREVENLKIEKTDLHHYRLPDNHEFPEV